MSPTTLDAFERVRSLLRDGPAEQRAAYADVARAVDEALARATPQAAEESPRKTRKDLISVICHDLKDPLASIVMGAGFLKKVLPEGDSLASARRVVDAILRSSARMNSVVDDFHALGKLETSTLSLDRHPHDGGAIVHAAFDAFVQRAAEKSIALTLAAPDTTAAIICDRAHVLNALSKLIGNALKFTPAGGTITLILEARDDGLWFAVRDTGRGIAEERLATVFDREVNALQTPRDGPGLGLAIVKGITALHGGRSGVESTLGAGSTFWMSLPRGDAQPSASQETA